MTWDRVEKKGFFIGAVVVGEEGVLLLLEIPKRSQSVGQ